MQKAYSWQCQRMTLTLEHGQLVLTDLLSGREYAETNPSSFLNSVYSLALSRRITKSATIWIQ